MPTQKELAETFLALHCPGDPLLLPNPWDEGSARLLASLGFKALATTSAGYAATRGRLDGTTGCDETIAHCAAIARISTVPVSADLENGFANDLAEVAQNYQRFCETGLAGGSIEDYDPQSDDIYDIGLATERVAAAAGAFHSGDARLVLTARAENFLHGRPDLDDTITRLQSYQQAGADALYAPFISDIGDIRRVVASVDRPVNVLARPNGPTVGELAAAGVARVSVGGAFAFAALGALIGAAREWLEKGTNEWFSLTLAGREGVLSAFD
jgi:2-methylisocitrate lyase-like PEP mutase family enzyme